MHFEKKKLFVRMYVCVHTSVSVFMCASKHCTVSIVNEILAGQLLFVVLCSFI